MKKSVVHIIHILFIIFVYENFNKLNSVQADDGKTTQEYSATITISENTSSVSGSEKENEDVNLVNSDLEPSVDLDSNFGDRDGNSLDNFSNQVFSEAVLQNSGGVKEIINNDTPIVLSLSDTATAELQKRADIPTLVTSQDEEIYTKNTSQDVLLTESREDVPLRIESNRSELNLSTLQTDKIVIDVPIIPKNLTEVKSEDIPSFSEWAQKHIEEAEKLEQVNSSSQGQNGKQGSGAKLRWKNYASLDCGAKVILANPEAVSPWAVLSPSRDEYILNTCTSRIWFIVELCEAIQVKKIDLANYELFSSSPKDFVVSVSDRFPTRDWSLVDHFTAKDERDIQSFDLNPQIFGKYIKIEIKSHYGSEHYCPLSLFRAYGTSVFEVLQKEDPAHVHRAEDDDDDDETLDTLNGDSPKNIFSSATDVVISMVKKAAEVLGNKVNTTNKNSNINDTIIFTPFLNTCVTPSHNIICNNCSNILFEKIYHLLSCKAVQIKNLVSIPFISKMLINSHTCDSFGFHFEQKDPTFSENNSSFVNSFFPAYYLGALCNAIASIENRISLNISQQYANITEDSSCMEKLVSIKITESDEIRMDTGKAVVEETIKNENEIQPTESLVLETTEGIPKATCSTDISYASQIKPTKALMSEPELSKSYTEASTKVSKDSNNIEDVETDKNEKITEESVSESMVDNNLEVVSELETSTQSTETVDDHLEHFISEFSGENTPSHSSSSASSASTPQAQKESVFLRLSNRIKTLERNMSLSSQYLEELSKRYKKQVEEMQRLLEKTIATLHEESKKKDDRYKQLEERLESLTFAVETLLAERNMWWSTFCWLFFTTFFSSVLFTFCRKSRSFNQTSPDTKETGQIQRRKSIDVVTRNPTQKKKRRPSDQALKIVTSSSVNNENAKEKQRKRKKKHSLVIPSNSINAPNEDNYNEKFSPKCTSSRIYYTKNQENQNGFDWVGTNHGIVDIPFVLEDSEHSTLEALPVPKDLNKVDAPVYLKTAMNSRSNRSSLNSPRLQGDVKENAEATKYRNKSPNLSVNGSVSSGTEPELITPKKERKGFKKFFKKVF